MTTFGKNLKKARLEANLTLEELANKIGTTKSAISRYENDLRMPNGDFIKDVSDVLNVSSDYLLGINSKCNNINKLSNPSNDCYTNPKIDTIAAHLAANEYSDEDLQDIKKFIEFVDSKKN